jgi:pyruvate/2-oxoglutarate dehydrogenase complex dihydrolipoamide acyltransferase (E2) component
MSATIVMPQLGETVAEGKILAWFKAVGDEIREGENLFEVETDKVTIDVPAIVSGRLSEIRVDAGEVAKVGDIVAVLGGSGETVAKAQPASTATSSPRARSPFEEVCTPNGKFGPAKGPQGVRISPLARRLIAQAGLDLNQLAEDAKRRGSDRVVEADVRAATARQGAAPPTTPPPAAPSPLPAPDAPKSDPAPVQVQGGQIISLNAVRLKTGARLAENWRNIPHVFQAIEVDFTAIDRVRAMHRNAFQHAQGFSLTYLPFIARATCLALQAFPSVNARFDGKALTLSREVHLAIAVDLSHDGLVAPVVRDAGDLALVGLAKAMRRQIDKARAGKLMPDDLAGGTYSISNNGAFGTTFTAPIINAPQVAILSTDAIRLKPAVVSTAEGDFVAPRMMGMVGQSFDHRAFDGAYSAVFLSRLKQILEERRWDDELNGQP